MRDCRSGDVTFYASPATVLGDDFSPAPTVSTGLAYSSHGDEVLLSVYDTHECAEVMLSRSEAIELANHLLHDFSVPSTAVTRLTVVRETTRGESV